MSSGNYVSVNGNLTDLYRPLTNILGLLYDDTMTYEERVQKRYDYVKEQLEKDPNYEGWDWVEYRVYSRTASKVEKPLYNTDQVLISTKGKIAKKKFNAKGTNVTIGAFSGRYLRTSARTFDGVIEVYPHRAIACTFIPKPEKYKNVFYTNLTANHKNLKVTHNYFGNIEWATQKDNVRHAVQNDRPGLHDAEIRTQSIVGEYTLSGDYLGKHLVFDSKQDVKRAGLDTISIYQAIRGEAETAYGCKWYRLPKDEVPIHNTKLLNHILEDRKRSLSTVKPLLVTIVKEGSMKGQQFVIIGAESVRGFGFDQGHVSKVCSGKLRTHSGCKWEYIPNEDVDKYQRDPTHQQLTYLGK